MFLKSIFWLSLRVWNVSILKETSVDIYLLFGSHGCLTFLSGIILEPFTIKSRPMWCCFGPISCLYNNSNFPVSAWGLCFLSSATVKNKRNYNNLNKTNFSRVYRHVSIRTPHHIFGGRKIFSRVKSSVLNPTNLYLKLIQT